MVPCLSYAKDTMSSAASEEQSGRFSLVEENDTFASNDDRHYTQGMRLSYLSGSDASDNNRSCDWTGLNLEFLGGDNCKRKYNWTFLGQSLFTPQNISASIPSSRDRPYGAWLYAGVSLLQESQQETHNTLDNFELLGGVVGPYALGDLTQNDFHQFIGIKTAHGWQNQIRNEPGLVLTHERKWRFDMPLAGNFGFDVIPEAGVTLGNIFTYGELGGMVRLGQNLHADYGPDRIRPSLSGTGWFDKSQLDGKFGWYVFAGVQGRVVGHNIFLDGNTFKSSPNVDKKPLVADFTGGVSLLWSDAIRADFSVVQRTKEFYGQAGSNDQFGGFNIVIGL